MGIIPPQQGVMNIWGLRKQEGIQALAALFWKRKKINKLQFFQMPMEVWRATALWVTGQENFLSIK